jgi:hypothetical protein
MISRSSEVFPRSAIVVPAVLLLAWVWMLVGQVSHASIDPKAAIAAGPIKIGTPVFGGGACPGASVRTRVEAGEQGASILAEMKASVTEAGGARSKELVFERCEVAIPVEVPTGFQVAMTGAKLAGAYDLPGGARAVVRTERSVSGGGVLKRTQQLVAPVDGIAGGFENEMDPTDAVWSACRGGEFSVRSSVNVALSNGSKDKAATFTFGTGREASAPVIAYKLEWRRCKD